jgi:hypothetical protein
MQQSFIIIIIIILKCTHRDVKLKWVETERHYNAEASKSKRRKKEILKWQRHTNSKLNLIESNLKFPFSRIIAKAKQPGE